MEWLTIFHVVVITQCSLSIYGFPQQVKMNIDGNPYGNAFENVKDDVEPYLEPLPLEDDVKVDFMSGVLTNILLQPWPKNKLPLIYVEEEKRNEELFDDIYPETVIGRRDDFQILNTVPNKRTRYYRKYPWKRQNSRQIYEPDNRYLCQPTKEDVFRLLVALHDARRGSRGRTIDFCNRKRPAQVIFTNIRFLGKRK